MKIQGIFKYFVIAYCDSFTIQVSLSKCPVSANCISIHCKAHSPHLSLTLIINLAGRLRRMIPLGEEHQKQQGEDIRDHQEQIRINRRKSHSQAELVAARPRDAEENADEEGRNDVPVAEDHRGDGKIAVAKIDTR